MPTETILSLPFAYEARFIRPRHRNHTVETVRDTVPVLVPVATREEAPVAFVLDWSERHGKQVEPLITRSFEGRLFRAIVDDGNTPVGVGAFEADVNRDAGDWRGTWLRDRPGRPTWSGDQFPQLPLMNGRQFGSRNPMRLMDLEELAEDVADQPSKFRLKGTDRTERAAEAQAFLARNLVCIDGTMWTTNYAVEPYWGVHDGKVSFSVESDGRWYLTPFRLDRLDHAVAFAAAQVGTAPAMSELPAVTVPNAALLQRDEGIMLARQLLSAGGWYSDAVSKREGWPPEAESLRSALRIWCEGEVGLKEAANLLDGFGRLREMLADLPREGYPGAAQVVERSGAAMERWGAVRETRPDMTALVTTAEDDEMAFATLAP